MEISITGYFDVRSCSEPAKLGHYEEIKVVEMTVRLVESYFSK